LFHLSSLAPGAVEPAATQAETETMAHDNTVHPCHAKTAPVQPAAPLDLDRLRRQLAEAQGPRYWRSLEELAATDGFQEMLHREFPRQASVFTGNRRDFISLMGASLAMAGMTACTRQPTELIVPYVKQPEDLLPGRPQFFATSMPLGGYGFPVLVRSDMGRPNKIEGNPDHPASLGGTDLFTQASVLGLYDPDRAQTPTANGEVRGWDEFLQALRARPEVQAGGRGTGLRILTETVTSPTLAFQLQNLLQRYPDAKWHQWEPINRDAARQGSQLAFGRMVDTHYQLDKADVILSLDADFLSSASHPAFLLLARQFGERRKLRGVPLNRLYAVESAMTLTGAKADHRMALRGSDIEAFAQALLSELGKTASAPGAAPGQAAWRAALVADLQQHRGRCVVLAGEQQSPAVHALAHALNAALGNVGATVTYTAPAEAVPVIQADSLRQLVQDMQAGQVSLLMILGGNPVFSAPADVPFQDALGKAGFRVHLSLYADETAALCDWHIPETHYLEAWSDVRSHDGTVGIVQPLIAPLYENRTAHEMLTALSDQVFQAPYDTVKQFWNTQFTTATIGGTDFEHYWRKSLHDGFLAGSAPAPLALTAAANLPAPTAVPQGLEISFRPDASVYDGRFINNGWLQELPRPITHVTWDSAALISVALAKRLNVVSEDIVALNYHGRQIELPVWIQAGQPDDVVTVPLGYGRPRTGRVGTGVGTNTYPLRDSQTPWFGVGLAVSKTGSRRGLAATHDHHSMEGRDLIRTATLAEYQQDPQFAHAKTEAPPPGLSLYTPYSYPGYAWGMAIDINSCIGCNACVVACQAENNIPIVGKAEVERGREMHWLRVDTYYTGNFDDPKPQFQPIPCMQCEDAPCEQVCPVGATVHSSEGLNDMVYNRCVGTRYCSNNCPYKVRRFNFLHYAWLEGTPSLEALQNPDVSVRSRGVMEKCTYCVQRINRTRINAEKDNRQVRDGEMQTACEQACPTRAITFGNIGDRQSRVAQLKSDTRNYGLLEEQGTRPRTTYLAAVGNPNPEIKI